MLKCPRCGILVVNENKTSRQSLQYWGGDMQKGRRRGMCVCVYIVYVTEKLDVVLCKYKRRLTTSYNRVER